MRQQTYLAGTLSLYEDEDTQAGPTVTAKLAVDILEQQLKSSMSMSSELSHYAGRMRVQP